VCYFTNWAVYRSAGGSYKPEDIDTSLCTHIVYGFAVLDTQTLTIKSHDSWADIQGHKFYEKVTALRSRGVKVLLAIGGWNDSKGDKYSRLVNNKESRRKFVHHVVHFITKYNFDGLDLDWEYPKCWQVDCSQGPASDKPAFTDLVRELSEAFVPRGLLLSAAVSPNYKVVEAGYDVAALNQYLDWIAVMTYDYHGHWDRRTGHVAPMFHHPASDTPQFNVDYSIRLWLREGASPRKLVLGMPMYGQSFTLASPGANTLSQPAYGKGEMGEATGQGGFLAFYEICERVLERGWAVEHDVEGRLGPYAHAGDQWVSFDDYEMIAYKSQYVKDMGLGGAMIWALDLDDFKGSKCRCEDYPLLKTINRVLGRLRTPQPNCIL